MEVTVMPERFLQQPPINHHRSFALALSNWFERHGKVVFVLAAFDVLLIVFCVIYWEMDLPMNPLRRTSTPISYHISSWLPSMTMFTNVNAELSGLMYKIYVISVLHLLGILYIVYSLMRIQYNQQHLLQKMVDFTRAFVDYKNTQSSNMQTICRFINRNQDHCNDVLDAISGLRTIHENEYRISLNAMNKIKQEMRTMRFEYHNKNENENGDENENVDEANTSVESTTPLRETRSRRKVGPSRLGTRIGLERVTT